MYRLQRTTFPSSQTVQVPGYRIETFNGQALELIQDPRCIQVNFAAMNAHAIARTVEVRPEGWELRGLIALNAVNFEEALHQVMTDKTSRRCGAVLGDDWYLLVAVDGHAPARAGEHLVVGLYR